MEIKSRVSANLYRYLEETKKLRLKSKIKYELPLFVFILFKKQYGFIFGKDKPTKEDLLNLSKIIYTEFAKKKSADITLNQLLLQAINLAASFKHRVVGTEHCLAVIFEQPWPFVELLVKKNKLDVEKIRQQITGLLRGQAKLTEISGLLVKDEEKSFDEDVTKSPLEIFGTELTNNKWQASVNPVINREDEITRMIQILCRKDKNNPLVLGEPGVGKTALVEGLAKKIINKEVPTILQHKKIFALDLAGMLSGTMYRGDFENRLKNLVDEIKKRPEVIIFIDEIHNLVGAGSNNGTMDAANILKPLLARGELRCIGATTLEEFKKHFEKDAALERRFQTIVLSEPTAESTQQILNGVKSNYENYHQVAFSPEAISAAIQYSQKYLPGKLFPDKAIDLLDESAARTKIAHQGKPEFQHLRKIEDEINKTRKEKTEAVQLEKYEDALRAKQKETLLTKLLEAEQTRLTKLLQSPENAITADDILNIIAQKSNIPVNEIKKDSPELLSLWRTKMDDHVVGQNQVLDKVFLHLKKHFYGLNDTNRPVASFLFCGPSGSGKTHTAKILAETVFHNPEALIKLDMSEFSEKFNASKLVGAPAGYVGYREGNKLTDAIKARPHSLVLFDEIDKAHPDVLHLLLQILEDGFITDSTGRRISFHQAIIVMTTNLGQEVFNRSKVVGFNSNSAENIMADAIKAEVKKVFKEELINRLDEVIIFNHLNDLDFTNIVEKEIKRKLTTSHTSLHEHLKNLNREKIVTLTREANSGARGIKKLIDSEILNILQS